MAFLVCQMVVVVVVGPGFLRMVFPSLSDLTEREEVDASHYWSQNEGRVRQYMI